MVNRLVNKILVSAFLGISLFVYKAGVLYAESAEVQALSFGNMAITSNDTVSDLVISHINGVSPISTNSIHILSFGTPGKYQLSGFSAYTPLVISVNSSQLSIGGAEPINVGSFTYNDVVTDESGNALLVIGAKLSTTGSGVSYKDATYSGVMTIVVGY